MNYYFEIYESINGWRWRLKSTNGEILATGEPYSNESNARRGIRTITNAVKMMNVPIVVLNGTVSENEVEESHGS